jgi:hypothetical protein
MEDSLCAKDHPCFYWMFVNRPMTPWFKATIVGDRKNHAQNVTMGTMLFFE